MIKAAIAKLVEGDSLTSAEAKQAMAHVMAGEATPSQLGALLVALRVKGETSEEIAGFAIAMRENALAVKAPPEAIDTCGTGGDASNSYNISTASAIVAAAAGIPVAKHGNRSATSKCGSADVLEALGVRIAVTPEQAEAALREIGIAFLFAPAFHPAMKHAMPTRVEIGIRTVFNILGPLSSPARVRRQVLGVAHADLGPKMSSVLRGLGVDHALVVHGDDGLDEISLSAPTSIHEVRGREVTAYSITPESLGLKRAPREALVGGDKVENAEIIRALFRGERGPKRDALLANAAAALYVGATSASIQDGVAAAARIIDSGAASEKLEAFAQFTHGLEG